LDYAVPVGLRRLVKLQVWGPLPLNSRQCPRHTRYKEYTGQGQNQGPPRHHGCGSGLSTLLNLFPSFTAIDAHTAVYCCTSCCLPVAIDCRKPRHLVPRTMRMSRGAWPRRCSSGRPALFPSMPTLTARSGKEGHQGVTRERAGVAMTTMTMMVMMMMSDAVGEIGEMCHFTVLQVQLYVICWHDFASGVFAYKQVHGQP